MELYGIHNYGNENKIILGYFNGTMDKINRNGENKTQRLYGCCSGYSLSKQKVDNLLEDLLGKANSNSHEFTIGPLTRIEDRQDLE